jgi:hypothetical protein
VHTGSEKKPGIFLVPHPELTTDLLKRASSSQGDDDSRTKRRRKAPSPTLAVWVMLLFAVTLVAGQNAPPSGDSEKSLADIALQQKLQRDLRDFCSKKKDSKLCKEKSPEKMAETIFKESTRGQVTKLIAEIEKFTGDDHSWSSGVSTGSAATGPSTVSDSKSYQQQLGEILDQLADKTPRQLGNDAVGDVQFPGRDSWEQRLYDQKLKFIAAGRHLQAVYASGIQGAINPADLDYRIQANVYNEIRAEGIGKAADWARKAQ